MPAQNGGTKDAFGDIAEGIVYDAGRADDDCSALEQTLAHHWAIGSRGKSEPRLRSGRIR
jgi:hypothetical protein